ncbi:MAG TPA: VOC family protein [Pirellulales bacterium]|nr:VOC family protein [Pirellulales bacterium]
MKRVTGIGGIFFKAENCKALAEWYERHLGIKPDAHGVVIFRWREGQTDERPGSTVWAVFGRETTYFEPSKKDFMLNYRVDDLDAQLAELAKEGVTIDPRREDSEFGRFAWIMDPEGNRIELWEPPAGA